MGASVRGVLLSEWGYRLGRWCLGVVFVYAGLSKLASPSDFAQIIAGFGLTPPGTEMAVALLLPAVEVLAGLGLCLDLRLGLGGVAAMLVLFIAVVGYGLWLGLDVDCGCFGPGDPEGEFYHDLRPTLYRDLAMLAVAAYLWWWRRARSRVPSAWRDAFPKRTGN